MCVTCVAAHRERRRKAEATGLRSQKAVLPLGRGVPVSDTNAQGSDAGLPRAPRPSCSHKQHHKPAFLSAPSSSAGCDRGGQGRRCSGKVRTSVSRTGHAAPPRRAPHVLLLSVCAQLCIRVVCSSRRTYVSAHGPPGHSLRSHELSRPGA